MIIRREMIIHKIVRGEPGGEMNNNLNCRNDDNKYILIDIIIDK